MYGVHNTHLKKLFSEKVETNSLEPLNIEVSKTVIPIVELQGEQIVSTKSSSGTVYTTPSDKTFYLTNVSMNGANDEFAADYNSLQFTAVEGGTKQILLCVYYNQANALDINFGKVGVKIEKNSVFSYSGASSLGHVTISGYLASDRS